MSKDIESIQQQMLQPLVDSDQEILLVCHSAAGLAGGAAALGYSKTERSARGQKDGIVGVILVAAFVAFKGLPPFSKLPDGSWPPGFNVDEDKCIWNFGDPSKLYAPDVPDEKASDAASALRPMSLNCITEIGPCLITDWADSAYKGHMAYIRCTQDQQAPLDFNDMALKHSGGDWTIHSMEAGHSPFLSCPAELATVITRFAEDFASD